MINALINIPVLANNLTNQHKLRGIFAESLILNGINILTPVNGRLSLASYNINKNFWFSCIVLAPIYNIKNNLKTYNIVNCKNSNQ